MPRLSRFVPNATFGSPGVSLNDKGPSSCFQDRLSTAYSFSASLLEVIDSVMSLALGQQEESSAP